MRAKSLNRINLDLGPTVTSDFGDVSSLDPWEFARRYRDRFHVAAFSTSFAEMYAFEPLLCVVKTKADGVEYFKSFDVFAECEYFDHMDAVESTRRTGQYTKGSLVEIEACLRYVFDVCADDVYGVKSWTFVRVADEHDTLWNDVT